MFRCNLEYTDTSEVTVLSDEKVYGVSGGTDRDCHFYVLAAMIRLAYFNVMERCGKNKDESSQKILSRTSGDQCSLIFPAVLVALMCLWLQI